MSDLSKHKGLFDWFGMTDKQLFEIHRALAQRPRTVLVNGMLDELHEAGITFEAEAHIYGHWGGPPITSEDEREARKR